ncbi:PEP/pyruvate-binding domain-containing protein [Magnetospirillum moscoviense]|uniref:Phosphoenolpyruvate synthase n=1 Tax=Magnetospirillum moscoviense TaxID=1437059 RepID=A0A178MTL2_9PROT|nr:PEP/pyruvate-binding domain-containing protein [Magnetospirillum moscoviense]OAN51501.1 phosphoenolpyruvate synthase [Magnetospirillum moscoviense]
MGFVFRSKAETLEALAGRLQSASVLPLFHVGTAEWKADRNGVLARLGRLDWAGAPLIVRSSAEGEDGECCSMAGKFLSLQDVGLAEAPAAIDRVAAAYGRDNPKDRVLIQPMLAGVAASGVAFTRDPSTGSPYLVVNGAEGADTSVVTGGKAGATWCRTHWRFGPEPQDDRIRPILLLARELIAITGRDALDIEFAFDQGGRLWLLQVRPLAVATGVEDAELDRAVRQVMAKVGQAMCPHPLLKGARTVFGIMPDWNPAEIIGVRPSPLALSLYRELVTDSIWAYQRHNYGYRNLRSFPLLVHFHGLPYIDVRVSFNSFVPRDVDGELAEKLVDYYIERLLARPSLHDKVEFEIVLSAYTFDMDQRLDTLAAHGFSEDECTGLADALRRLTNTIINRKTGLWQADIEKVRVLEERRQLIQTSRMSAREKVYWLLEDCKRYGTLPFAGLARAGFVAVQMLRSLVAAGVLAPEELNAFLGGLNTVGSELAHDTKSLDKAAFLAKYGHLRPGTYDLRSPRYDRAPELYGIGDGHGGEPPPRPRFALSLPQMRAIESLLAQHGLDNDVVGLFDFFQAAIEGREKSKFIFTRALSDALELLAELGESAGFARDDMAFADIAVVREWQASCADDADTLAASIARGRAQYRLTQALLLPALIAVPGDVWSFATLDTDPNFITLKSVTAPARRTGDSSLAGAIVCIESADPGFDWIFAHGIAGLVTAFGGTNSHMAIRAAELGIPAVIGAGLTKYSCWANASVLHLDCANRKVEVVR